MTKSESLGELRAAEDEAYAALQHRFVDAVLHEASEQEWGEVVSAYRTAVRATAQRETGERLHAIYRNDELYAASLAALDEMQAGVEPAS